MIAGAFITVAYFDLYFYFVAFRHHAPIAIGPGREVLAPEPVRGRPLRTVIRSVPPLPVRTPPRALPSPRRRHA